jgi:hypothetical protein
MSPKPHEIQAKYVDFGDINYLTYYSRSPRANADSALNRGERLLINERTNLHQAANRRLINHCPLNVNSMAALSSVGEANPVQEIIAQIPPRSVFLEADEPT